MLKKRLIIIILVIILVLLCVLICMNVILMIQSSRMKGMNSMVGDFSYKEDLDNIDIDSAFVKTDGFVNTDEFKVDEYNVYKRAVLELEDPDIVVTYSMSYDKTDDMWCVRFGKKDDDTHYLIWFETVYLTGKGVTVLINSDEYTDYSTKIT